MSKDQHHLYHRKTTPLEVPVKTAGSCCSVELVLLGEHLLLVQAMESEHPPELSFLVVSMSKDQHHLYHRKKTPLEVQVKKTAPACCSSVAVLLEHLPWAQAQVS